MKKKNPCYPSLALRIHLLTCINICSHVTSYMIIAKHTQIGWAQNKIQYNIHYNNKLNSNPSNNPTIQTQVNTSSFEHFLILHPLIIILVDSSCHECHSPLRLQATVYSLHGRMILLRTTIRNTKWCSPILTTICICLKTTKTTRLHSIGLPKPPGYNLEGHVLPQYKLHL